MSETTRQADPSLQGPDLTANDRLKDRWESRLALSVIAAVVLHAAFFLLRPGWGFPQLQPVGEPGSYGPDVLVATDLAPAGGGSAAVAPAIGEPSDSTRDEETPVAAGEGAAADGGADGDGTSARALRDRLGDANRPSLAATDPGRNARTEPPPRPSPERESGASTGPTDDGPESALSIGGHAATAEMTEGRQDDGPSLDRLRALDPEVVTGLGSSEVLLRNPGEVVRFKETMVRRHPEVATTEAWVSVAIWVDEDGSVEWAEVSESSGTEVLDEAALRLFADVVAFRPALEDGDRVPKSMLFYLLFPW